MARVRLARGVERAFVRYARKLERKLNGGTRQHGVIAAVPRRCCRRCSRRRSSSGWPMPCIRCSVSLVNVVVLYFLMGFRRFSHAISAIVAALQAGDIPAGAPRARGVARRLHGAT